VLKRLARGGVRHRRLVITAWLVGVVGMLGLGVTFAGENNTDFSLPGTESQQAADLLEAAYGCEDPFATGQVVIATDPSIEGGVHNPEVQTLVENLLAGVAEVPSGEIDSSERSSRVAEKVSLDWTHARGQVSWPAIRHSIADSSASL